MFKLTAKTLFGLEDLLSIELEKLGAKNIEKGIRAVSFTGDLELIYRINFNARLTTRVLRPLIDFRAESDDQLYKKIYDYEWSKIFSPNKTISIDTFAVDSFVRNSHFISQKAKDAIVDYFRKKTGKRPSVDVKSADVRINLHINKNRAIISLDSSGDPLNKRGYRKAGGKAPLNEVLAAGIIELTEWNGTTPFYDPMCGSGTLPIEAAMKASNIVPGLLRKNFCFHNWLDYDPDLFRKVVTEAKSKVALENLPAIGGSDISHKAIGEAGTNAKRSKLAKQLNFDVLDISNARNAEGGTVVLNPPYDSRLKSLNIQDLYRQIGDALKSNFAGNTAYILTGNFEAAKSIGLRTSRKIKLYNGPIECRLLRFDLYRGSRKTKHNSD